MHRSGWGVRTEAKGKNNRKVQWLVRWGASTWWVEKKNLCELIIWGNEPEACVFLSLWFSRSHRPPLHSFRKSSQHLQEKSKYVCFWSQTFDSKLNVCLTAVRTCVWLCRFCFLAFRSLCGFRLAFGFLALSLLPGVPLTCCHDLSFSAPAAQSETKWVKPDYEGSKRAAK